MLVFEDFSVNNSIVMNLQSRFLSDILICAAFYSYIVVCQSISCWCKRTAGIGGVLLENCENLLSCLFLIVA